jgi:CRISPR/Cas system CSM-associated protein Csm2 small subunit
MMTLNIYKNQNEVEKVYETEGYDIMYGTVEDILGILDEVGDNPTDTQLFKTVAKNREKLNTLLKEIFPDLTDEEFRRVKLKELVPFFLSLFAYVKSSFGDPKN